MNRIIGKFPKLGEICDIDVDFSNENETADYQICKAECIAIDIRLTTAYTSLLGRVLSVEVREQIIYSLAVWSDDKQKDKRLFKFEKDRIISKEEYEKRYN